jgi:hypothetical protein
LPTSRRLDASARPSESAEIDLAAHLVNRLTFGARPGDYARVAALGPRTFIEEQLAPARIGDFTCERALRHNFDHLADPKVRSSADAAMPTIR